MSDVCAACNQAIAENEKPTKDKKGRLYHGACAQKLMQKHRERQAAAAAAAQQQPDNVMDTLLAGAEKATAVTCPNCSNLLAEGTALCVRCGYNFVTGKGTRTQVEKLPSGAKAAAGAAASTSMGWLFALIGSSVGGAIGAGVWSAISYHLNAEVGYVAVGVGFLAGVGAALGARQHTGLLSGLIASVVAIASIFGGKFMAAKFVSEDFAQEIRQTSQGAVENIDGLWMDEQEALYELINDDSLRQERSGAQLRWPVGQSWETAYELEHFPQSIVQKHQSAWDAMDDAQRRATVDGLVRENMIQAYADEMAYEREAAGQTLAWPAGMNYEDSWLIEDYPSDIVAEATARWDGMTREEQAKQFYGDSELLADFIESDAGVAITMVAREGISGIFFSLIWIVLAVGTAFGIGTTGVPDGK